MLPGHSDVVGTLPGCSKNAEPYWFCPSSIEQWNDDDVSFCVVVVLFDGARASCPLSSLILEFPGLSGAADALPLAASLPLAIDLVFIEPDMYYSN